MQKFISYLISRVTKKYIHLTLISSETTQVADFAGDITVKSNHEKGTIQSYYNLEKINSLLNEVNCKIIFNRKIHIFREFLYFEKIVFELK